MVNTSECKGKYEHELVTFINPTVINSMHSSIEPNGKLPVCCISLPPQFGIESHFIRISTCDWDKKKHSNSLLQRNDVQFSGCFAHVNSAVIACYCQNFLLSK